MPCNPEPQQRSTHRGSLHEPVAGDPPRGGLPGGDPGQHRGDYEVTSPPTVLLVLLPELAKERGIQSGSWVQLTSRYGRVRVRALVTIGGYNVQNTLAPPRPASAEDERGYWYQWYFNTERGRLGLEQNRREICRLLWRAPCPRTC